MYFGWLPPFPFFLTWLHILMLQGAGDAPFWARLREAPEPLQRPHIPIASAQ